jgi:DNA invertase Pin-like site-specific DNA recombinase
MATPGRPLDDRDRERIRRALEHSSVRDTARRYGVSPTTVQKISATGIAK